jgi:transaldolase / glucose-6-phosphate isomerase
VTAREPAPNPLLELQRLGQSPWHDNIHRGLLRSGALARMVRDGDVVGLTSNPTIFDQAIAQGSDYDATLATLAAGGRTPEAIVDALVVEDIQAAADIFLPVFQRSRRADGYVSVEIAPALAHDSAGSLREARRLWRAVNRPNVMVKIPATTEGLPVIEECIAAGMNVNVTLIFSLHRYREVMNAYVRGLTRRLEAGMRVDRIASVASFFVSRVDTEVDRLLEERAATAGGERRAQLERLRGKAAIAQAKLAYLAFRVQFAEEHFGLLAREGARPQRPLWASTSTKNPAYPDVYYVEALIGPDTVNTMPPATLAAYKDHGHPEDRLAQAVDRARAVLAQLAQFGIDMEAVTQRLETQGVAAFARSWQSLIDTVSRRREALRLATRTKARLGPAERAVARALGELTADRVGERLWAEDPTLWKRQQGTPGTGSNAWLAVPDADGPAIAAVATFAQDVRNAGLTRALVCGVGADPVPAEVFRRALGVGRGWLDVQVLDVIDPASVVAAATRAEPARTLYVLCATGSMAIEPAFRVLWERASEALGSTAGTHFAAIGTPGGALESLAGEHRFRRMFRTPADVSGRWAALSALGLVPAALLGADLTKLVERATRMITACSAVVPPRHNPGLWLGAALGALARSGRDKLTVVLPDRLAAFGGWIEQLVAGATGKHGRGLVPVVGEPLGAPRLYGKDRLFVHLRLGASQDRAVAAQAAAGHPIVTINLLDAYDLAGEIVRWEIATAAAARLLDVHPFAEPETLELEAATHRALATAAAHPLEPLSASAPDFAARLGTQLAAARGRRWVAISAWVAHSPRRQHLLSEIRAAIRKRFGVATTLAFGGAALHHTGQLHVGGPPTAIVLDLTADPVADVPVPGTPHGLAAIQAADTAARALLLTARRRPLLHVHLGRNVEAGLTAMLAALQRPSPKARTAGRRKPVAARARASARR